MRFYGSDESVASVSEDGLVTALRPGSLSVTVATYNNKKKSGTIEVRPAPSSIEVASTELCLGAGTETVLSASINEGSAGLLRFQSDNPEAVSYTHLDVYKRQGLRRTS